MQCSPWSALMAIVFVICGLAVDIGGSHRRRREGRSPAAHLLLASPFGDMASSATCPPNWWLYAVFFWISLYHLFTEESQLTGEGKHVTVWFYFFKLLLLLVSC